MLKRLADRVQLRTSTDTPAQPVRAVAPIAPRAFQAGDELRGYIESVQADGLFKVLIEERPFLLRLPFTAKTGATIQLTVAAREPALKFEISEYPDSPAQATRLSHAARFITALLAESEKLPLAARIPATTPLLPSPPADGKALASALSNALAHSGMFYESHQAQWSAGERALVALRNEPQARLKPLQNAADVSVPSATGETPSAQLPVHRDALAIVRQQLETLGTGHVVWNGFVWNDQSLEWHLTERQPDAAAAPDESHWQTSIALALPRLGDVRATLRIDRRGVSIAIQPAAAQTAQALATQRPALQAALRSAGVHPLGIAIDIHEIP